MWTTSFNIRGGPFVYFTLVPLYIYTACVFEQLMTKWIFLTPPLKSKRKISSNFRAKLGQIQNFKFYLQYPNRKKILWEKYLIRLQIFVMKRHRFNPWVRKITWSRKWQAIPVFLSGEIPWTEEPGGLLPIGSQRVRHGWAYLHTFVIMVIIPYQKKMVS